MLWRNWSKLGQCAEKGVDARIPGYVNGAANALARQIPRSVFGRREKQICLRVDRGPIFLFWPGLAGIVGSQAGFDMRLVSEPIRRCRFSAAGLASGAAATGAASLFNWSAPLRALPGCSRGPGS